MLTQNDLLWRNLDWNLLRTFHEIAKHGGVSAAAEVLGRGQPSVSQALARLEDTLGVSLCKRGPSGFELTPEGHVLLQISSDLVTAVREIPSRMQDLAGQMTGRLRIAMMSGLVSKQVDQALSDYTGAHPLVELEIVILPWRSVLDTVQQGDAEIGLSYVQTVSAELAHIPVFQERQQAYCSSSHALSGQAIPIPEVLAKYPFVLTGRDEPVELSNYRRRFGLGQVSSGGSEDVTELARLIGYGHALGFLPEQVAEAVGGLWPLLDREDLPEYPVYATARPAEYRTAPAEVFWENLICDLKN